MMTDLQSKYFHLSVFPETGSFTLRSKISDLEMREARLGLCTTRPGESPQVDTLAGWPAERILTAESISLHGTLRHLEVDLERPGGLNVQLTFALSEDHPLALWRMRVLNGGSQPVNLQRFDLLRHGQLHLGETNRADDLVFFSNGWQSWNYSRMYAAGEKARRTRLGFLTDPQVVSPGTPVTRRAGHHSSDFFSAVGNPHSRNGLVLGFLSQQQQFGTVEGLFQSDPPLLNLWANGDNARLDPGCGMITDWAVLSPADMDERDPLSVYVDAVAREHQLADFGPIPTGWCSWYEFFTDISEEKIHRNLARVLDLRPRVPLELVQIDDGFESQVGDWFTFKPEFPNGVAPLAAEIKSAGLIPGLWLAPFILHPEADVIRQHPDWLLRDEKGRPVRAGYNWNTFTRALDLTVPAALDYAARAVATAVHEWGFPYLKLDFLYAGGLAGKHADPTLTRAQILRRGMQRLRQAAGPQARLLSCGAPLGSSLGLFEAMRIGMDIGDTWRPVVPGKRVFYSHLVRNEPNFPSMMTAMQNILMRAPFHRRWWINDPDVLLVRPNMDLNLTEVRSLASAIALSGGSMLLSDDLPALPDERVRLAEVLLPVIGERPQVIDWFEPGMPRRLRVDVQGAAGEWSLLAYFNWEDQPTALEFSPAAFCLPDDEYWSRSFWDGQVDGFSTRKPLIFKNVPPHGVVLTAVRRILPGQPQYLGSDLHISQGMEVTRWTVCDVQAELTLFLPRRCRGEITLALPVDPLACTCQGQPLPITCLQPGIYTVPVALEGAAQSITLQLKV